MFNTVRNAYLRHKHFWSKTNIVSLATGFGFFISALIVQHFVYNYIDRTVKGTPVGDLVLDHLAVVNLDFFIVEGALVSTVIVMILFLLYPRYLIFSLKALAFFIIIRSFFISLTHLGTNLHQITLDHGSIGFFLYDFLYNAKNDFFFSGHVGASFLFALIFWKQVLWRATFLGISIIFAVSMLLAHMHYSIDIFAAPFITYGIFTISKRLFRKDFKLFEIL
ncbi:MAG: hypothetical protein EXS52_00855 [Candidatus Staskawiczbacteria bacterium]|nr:hypothetical protein [Candidatus Staskawiczbacteria bacterium]